MQFKRLRPCQQIENAVEAKATQIITANEKIKCEWNMEWMKRKKNKAKEVENCDSIVELNISACIYTVCKMKISRKNMPTGTINYFE